MTDFERDSQIRPEEKSDNASRAPDFYGMAMGLIRKNGFAGFTIKKLSDALRAAYNRGVDNAAKVADSCDHIVYKQCMCEAIGKTIRALKHPEVK